MNRCNRYIYAIILEVLIIIFFILSMIYSSKILSKTSSGNLFELEEQSDKMNYFKNNISFFYPDKAYCICGEEAFLDFCNEELLKSGCKNFYENKKSKNLRKFTQCKEIEDKILNKNLALKDIFKLNTGSIHSSIIALNVVNIITFIVIILYFPGIELYIITKENEYNQSLIIKDDNNSNCCEICCKLLSVYCIFFCFGILILLILFIICISILIIFILTIILFSFACRKYNTDETNKYLVFLNCPNVNKEGFYKYSLIGDLSSDFTAFKIVQSFYIITTFICAFYTTIEKFIG